MMKPGGHRARHPLPALLVIAALAAAAPAEQPWPAADLAPPQFSVLLAPPADLRIYSRPAEALKPAQRMNIAIHGIRLAALHPAVWGVRRIDRTENRNIVPIRPFYLRASEDPSFELSRIELRLGFRKTRIGHMLKFREQKTAVLDIEFGGRYEKGPPGARDLRDSAYVARISATPLLASGFYYRSHESYVPLRTAAPERIETDKLYDVVLSLDQGGAVLLLDGREAARIEAAPARGLLSLEACWLPADVERLRVQGTVQRHGTRRAFEESGLAAER